MTDPLEILRQYWKYPDFRPGQREIIDHVLAGHDTLALLPTGGGKSLCFQVPALAREGVTLVVSPLIALMKDQVRQLRDRGIAADALYSGMRHQDIDRLLDNAVYGNTKLLYLSPERLVTDLARARIRKMNVSLLAVDEAHCISQWGYDFRPPYLRIAEIRELHPEVPVLAVTATATPEVVEDIQEQLAFRPGSRVFRHSFARDNLRYVVRSPQDKASQILDVLRGVPGTSIVYVRSRGMTRQLATLLQRRGIAAGAYHAGLTAEERDEQQAAWIEGRLRVIVATNAFGMGIDKADVRSVIHYGPPDAPEAYFQESGRGGRDGRPAYAITLYEAPDGERLHLNWSLSYPELPEIKRVYRALGSYLQLAVGGGQGEAFDFDITAFSKNFGFDVRIAYSGLKALERSGYILLTEAVHQPASLQFVVSKETLYDYQLKNPKLNRLIKSILRTSQGAFIQPVRIREGKLANFLDQPIEQFRKTLGRMKADGVIDYFPEKNDPQVVFLEERIDPDNLRLNHEQYNFLRDRALHRITTMIDYCEQQTRCRTHDLLTYFGESPEDDCGHCDVCLARKRSANPPLVARKLYAAINARMGDGGVGELSVEEVVAGYGRDRRREVNELLQQLIDEGMLVQEGDHIRRP